MKIDFHLHTPASVVNGDSIKWISLLDTIKELHRQDIKAFAFTDHNFFDSTQYLEAKKIVGENMHIFPGVEIDILKKNNIKAHILLLFDPLLSEQAIMEIEHLCKKYLRKNGIRIEKLDTIFKGYETIRIPHVGKSDFFKYDELLNIEHDAIETTSFTNPNYMNWLKNGDKSIVAFSDTHMWDNYPQNSYLYTEIDFDGTFKDLKIKLLNKKNYCKGGNND